MPKCVCSLPPVEVESERAVSKRILVEEPCDLPFAGALDVSVSQIVVDLIVAVHVQLSERYVTSVLGHGLSRKNSTPRIPTNQSKS